MALDRIVFPPTGRGILGDTLVAFLGGQDVDVQVIKIVLGAADAATLLSGGAGAVDAGTLRAILASEQEAILDQLRDDMASVKTAVESTNPTPIKAAPRVKVDATILDNGTLSDQVDLGDATLVGIVMPTSGWVAAVMTFKVSFDGITFQDLRDESGEVALSVSNAQYIRLEPSEWLGVQHIQLRSGTSASPVSQTGGPLTIGLITVP